MFEISTDKEEFLILTGKFLKLSGSNKRDERFNFFRSRSVRFFRFLLEQVDENSEEYGLDELKEVLENIVLFLIDTKRLYDISSIYSFLRKLSPEKLFPFFKENIKIHLSEIFLLSITYRSSSLDQLFFDVLGDNTPLLMEILGHLFRERGLFNIPLSVPIWNKLIEIADGSIKSFVSMCDPLFLSFYLNRLPELEFVPEEHVARWTRFILSPSTSRSSIEKIVEAMEKHPSCDILFILTLMSKDDLRGRALDILWRDLKKNRIRINRYQDGFLYFLRKSIESHFYDFHQISQKQKILISNMILAVQATQLVDRIVSIIEETGENVDPKEIETKRIFISLLGKMAKKDRSVGERLKSVSTNSDLDEVIKNEAFKALKNLE